MEKQICPHCESPHPPGAIEPGIVRCGSCGEMYGIKEVKQFATWKIPKVANDQKYIPMTVADFLDKTTYCGCLKPRPRIWSEEDEAALRAFTFAGSCSCDGAYDEGCPWCTDEQFNKFWQERLRARLRLPSDLCAVCMQPLSGFTTGKNPSPLGWICGDCYYGEFGKEIDNDPIGGLK